MKILSRKTAKLKTCGMRVGSVSASRREEMQKYKYLELTRSRNS